MSELPSVGGAGLASAYNQLATQLVDSHGYEQTVAVLARLSGYESTPPTINEFVDDNQYLGEVLKDEDTGQSNLFPVWRSALNHIYPNQFFSPCIEVCVTGAIGIGKTTLSKIGSMYDVCKLLHLKNPQKKYRLVKTTKVAYALINATLGLTFAVVYDELMEWIEASQYFRTQVHNSHPNTMFPKLIDVVTGSRFGHTLGQAIFGAVLSEVNFQDKIADQAYNNYTNIKRRMQSRFLGKRGIEGEIPGHLWLDSSKADQVSFLQDHIERVRKEPNVAVFDHPIWEVQKHLGIYSGKNFKVFIGDKTRDPFVINRPDQIVGIGDEYIIDVPVEYQSDFELDIHNALRDLAGKGTWTTFTFIPSVEKVKQALDRKNPVGKVVIKLDFYDESQLIDYLNLDILYGNPAPRFVHIDLGLVNDRTGIAMSSVIGYLEVLRQDLLRGKVYKIREPVFLTEFVMGIEPTPGNEVPIFKIKNFIIDLIKRNIPIGKITMDGYQSTNLRQDLNLLRIPTELLSVDRIREPYDNLKNIILEGRYHAPDHEIFKDELLDLVDLGHKVDHSHTGSKDIADAAAGSTWAAKLYLNEYGTVDVRQYAEAIEDAVKDESTIYDQIWKSRSTTVDVIQ